MGQTCPKRYLSWPKMLLSMTWHTRQMFVLDTHPHTHTQTLHTVRYVAILLHLHIYCTYPHWERAVLKTHTNNSHIPTCILFPRRNLKFSHICDLNFSVTTQVQRKRLVSDCSTADNFGDYLLVFFPPQPTWLWWNFFDWMFPQDSIYFTSYFTGICASNLD